jgi:hypothetical protein
MKTRLLPSLAAAVLALVATNAHAFPLRSPQVVFNSGPLQAYLNIVDPGINVLTDQLDAQVWATGATGNVDITLTLKSPAGGGNESGIYNAANAVPNLCPVFPVASIAGWYSTLHFAGGSVGVSTFDQNSVFLGTVNFPGVNPNAFAWYTKGLCGTWYSQDFRNPNPQMLAYESPAVPDDYWLCWNACGNDPAANIATFADVVLNVQSVHPTPTTPTTWGQLKGRYR